MQHEHQLKFHEMQAMFYMFSAITGHTQSRNLFHGDGKPFRMQEKINDSMDIAQRHINLYRELAESLDSSSKQE
jgi:hypothetical protein